MTSNRETLRHARMPSKSSDSRHTYSSVRSVVKPRRKKPTRAPDPADDRPYVNVFRGARSGRRKVKVSLAPVTMGDPDVED